MGDLKADGALDERDLVTVLTTLVRGGLKTTNSGGLIDEHFMSLEKAPPD